MYSLFSLLVIIATPGCASHEASAPQAVRVALDTELGTIRIELYPDRAPHSAGDFLNFIDNNGYQDAGFYRVVRPDNDNGAPKISVIQGGVLEPTDDYDGLPHEPTNQTGLRHQDGAVSIARGDVGTGSAAYFFIVLGDQPGLDAGGLRNPDGQGFAVFGQVTEGMDLVRQINAMTADGASDSDYMRGQILSPPIRFAARRE